RLLILNSYASYLTLDFLEYYKAKRIIVIVYLLYSTHSLQLLDIMLFSLLLKHYTKELT
ncbi:hypothetical protein CC77DRAFT_951349, partial [Alternaria alternata]